MPQPLSVNEALDNVAQIAGLDVSVSGVLACEHESVALYHHPKAEIRGEYESSIWLYADGGSLRFDRQTRESLNGKRVIVSGTLLGPDKRFGGCGHMGLWTAEILVKTMERN